jgi:hypothetical protein
MLDCDPSFNSHHWDHQTSSMHWIS